MINKSDVRIVKGDYNTDGRYWYYPELRIIKKHWYGDKEIWFRPYIVNYNDYSTGYKLDAISPDNEYKLKEFLRECYDWLVKYDELPDWKITNWTEYNEVYNLGVAKIHSKNNEVYFD